MAGEPTYMVINASQESINVLDLTTIRKSPGGWRVWVHMMTPPESPITSIPGQPVDAMRTFLEFNCEREEFRLLQTMAFLKGKNIYTGDYDPNEPWGPVPPLTGTRTALQAVCKTIPVESRTVASSMEEVEAIFLRARISAKARAAAAIEADRAAAAEDVRTR